MQFNMYHHYTVDEHLLRCIGILAEIERGGSTDTPLANELIHKIQPAHRSAALRRAVPARHRQGPARGPLDRRRARRAAALPAARLLGRRDRDGRVADRETSVMSSVAQSRDLSDRKTIENFAAVVQSVERLKLLTILTTADIKRGRARRVERLEGAAHPHALLRDRAGADRRLLGGQPRPARGHGAGRIPRRMKRLAARAARRLYRAALSGLLAEGRPAAQDRACAFRARRRGRRKALATTIGFDADARGDRTHGARAGPSVAAVDHRRRLRDGRRQHRRRADLHDHRRPRARHHLALARVRSRRGRGAPRRPHCRHDREGAARRAAAARRGGQARAAEGPHHAPSRSSRRSPSTISGRTATRWSKSPGSIAPACSTS